MFELSGSQFEKGVLDLRLEKSPAKTAGQDDHDGDGNEQIDDAIIVES